MTDRTGRWPGGAASPAPTFDGEKVLELGWTVRDARTGRGKAAELGRRSRRSRRIRAAFFRFLIFENDGERGWEDAMRNPIEFVVQQQTNTPNREQLRKHPYGRRILRSWYSTRLTVGILGIAMPFVLIIGDLFVLEGSAWTRGSLSAYYHSGVRDVFVGVLCIVGVFLISYRMSDWRHPDNWLSTAAGIAALLVAFFPTTTGDGEIPTPWQVELGEPLVARIHLVAAAVFLLALAGVSYLFSRRDSANRLPRNATLHRVCTAIMLVACVGFVVLAIVGVDKTGSFAVLLIAEVVSTLAFGVSWLVKGAELRLALAADERDQRSDATASVTVTASKPVVT